MTIHSEHEYRGYTIKIEYDEDPQNPREEWENMGTLALHEQCQYRTADERFNDRLSWAALKVIGKLEAWAKIGGVDLDDIDMKEIEGYDEVVETYFNEDYVVISLDIRNHGCQTAVIYSRGFDTDRVDGYLYCSLETAIDNWCLPKDSTWETAMPDWRDKEKQRTLLEAAMRTLEGEAEIYAAWLEGEVYGYDIEDLDSCWGYFGDDGLECAIEDAKGIINGRIARLEEKKAKQVEHHFNQIKAWIKHRVPLYYRKPLVINI